MQIVFIILTLLFFYPVDLLEGSQFRFTFNPPDGITCTVTSSISKIKEFDEIDKKQVDQGEMTSIVSIHKNPQGYTMNNKLTSVQMTRDGQPIPDPISLSMKDLEIIYHLNLQGHIMNIDGYDRLIEKIKSNFPSLPPTIMNVINEDALINEEITEYNGRVGDFIGKDFQIGDVWETESEFQLPDGNIMDFFVTTKFIKMQPCANTQCVRIEYNYDTDAEGFSDLVEGVIQDLKNQSEKIEDMHFSEITMFGDGMRLIDPNTMLVYEEQMNRTMQLPVEVPNKGSVQVRMIENKKHTYKCD